MTAGLRASSNLELLPSRPPTPIPRSFLLSCIAPLRLRLAVELPTGHVIDAPLTGVGREVALDRLSRGAGPRVLGRRAGTCLLGLLRLGVRRSGLAGEAILIVGAFRAVAGVPAHVASRI